MAEFLVVRGARSVFKGVKILASVVTGKRGPVQALRDIREVFSDAWTSYRGRSITAARREAMEYVNKGVRLYNSKHYVEALAAFHEAAICDPCYARAHMYLGNTQYKLSEQGEAVKAWERAVAVEPDSEAAVKAHLKLERLRSQNQRAIRELHEQIRK